jgi:hypothetical protein
MCRFFLRIVGIEVNGQVSGIKNEYVLTKLMIWADPCLLFLGPIRWGSDFAKSGVFLSFRTRIKVYSV